MKQRKRPCRICRVDLNLWGNDRKGICPDCAKAAREVVVCCAGNCGGSYQVRLMERLSLYFAPGSKGSKKYSLYYCHGCFEKIRARVIGRSDIQSDTVEKAEKRRGRKSA